MKGIFGSRRSDSCPAEKIQPAIFFHLDFPQGENTSSKIENRAFPVKMKNLENCQEIVFGRTLSEIPPTPLF
jgi:hypothetical protein